MCYAYRVRNEMLLKIIAEEFSGCHNKNVITEMNYK